MPIRMNSYNFNNPKSNLRLYNKIQLISDKPRIRLQLIKANTKWLLGLPLYCWSAAICLETACT